MASDSISLSSRLYPRHCVDVAAQAFRELCNVEIEEASGDRTLLRVRPLVEGQPHLVPDFLNYALMASLEWHLSGHS